MSAIKDYAFASGGILWRIFDRSKFLAQGLRRQVYLVFGLVLLCWLPLALLSLFKLGWDQFFLLFVRDISTHVRLLLVIPILIFARHPLNKSFNNTISFFYETKIIDDTNSKEFERIIRRLEKWKNSKIIDFIIIILVYVSFFIQKGHNVNHTSTYAPWHMMDDRITPAGWWYLIFSLPVLQMLLYRWLFTIILWIVFLRKILKSTCTFPRFTPMVLAALAFCNIPSSIFFRLPLAFSALTAGVTNNLIMFSGISLTDYKVAIGSVLAFVLLLFILPLMLLIPLLVKVKRNYFMQYSLQSWPITRKYEKELEDFYQTEKENPDTSWHVDLLGSFEKAQSMKIILIDKIMLLAFTSAVIIPFLPVVAQQVPLKEVLLNLLGKILG